MEKCSDLKLILKVSTLKVYLNFLTTLEKDESTEIN